MYNIVIRPSLISEFKKSKYFRQNLGLVGTVEKNEKREYNKNDKFSYFYNVRYKTIIYSQGNIGTIGFYIDYYIHDDVIAMYFNEEEFIYEFDFNHIKDKGIDSYLGHLLKKTDDNYSELVKKEEVKKETPKVDGNSKSPINNPGGVVYDDIMAYLNEKNKKRYSV